MADVLEGTLLEEHLNIKDPTTPRSFSQVVLSSRIPERESLSKLLEYFSSTGGPLILNTGTGADVEEIIDIRAEINMIRGLNKYTFRGHIMTKTKVEKDVVPLIDLIYDNFIENRDDESVLAEQRNKPWNKLQQDIMSYLRQYCLAEAAKYSVRKGEQ